MIKFIDDLFTCRELVSTCESLGNQLVIISDENVASLYAQDLLKCFDKPPHLLTITPGEQSKTRETKQVLEDQMCQLDLGRDTCVIALGGGVVTDLAGFVAATYCRGVPVVYIPTSLLAMTDAAIGGKTGVNTSFGKNLIGTFTQPEAIFIDLNTLNTLPEEERFNGTVEMLKHGLIADEELFYAIAGYDEVGELIQKSITIKQNIVKQDAAEKGLRQLLNFGHTIGHAIEHASHYEISHGQAVAVGIQTESYISNQMGLLPDQDFNKILDFFRHKAYILNCTADKIKRALILDKKSQNKTPRFVLLKSIGQAYTEQGYAIEVDNDLIDQAINWMFTHVSRKH